MERSNRIAQIYGYAVCLIAVIVFLINVNSFIDQGFSLMNPLRARGTQFGGEPPISSFEAYRASVAREGRPNGAAAGQSTSALPDSVLRARYEAYRADRIDQARFDAERGLTTSGLLLVLSIVLFILHWRWLRSPGVHAEASP